MRVLMTTDTVGGVWTYALQLTSSLERHGVQVVLAAMGGPLSTTQREDAARLSNVQVFESTYKLEWMVDPWDDVVTSGEWLLDLEKLVRPDVVHLNSYAHGALAWRAPAIVVGHSCVLSWWEAVKGGERPAEWNRYRHEVARGLRGARLVVAPTTAMLQDLRKHYGPLPGSRVVYNGRDELLFVPGRKEHSILSVGRLWDEAKNVKVLADTASTLDWPVYLAGDSKHPDGGEATFPNVTMLGQLPSQTLARRFSSASIYCLPALYEPFGLSVLEAGLARCALVLGDIPSLREVWQDAAVYVPPRDPDALRDALERLISDSTLRDSMSRRSRQRAMTYTPRRMSSGYYDIYTEVTGRQSWPGYAASQRMPHAH